MRIPANLLNQRLHWPGPNPLCAQPFILVGHRACLSRPGAFRKEPLEQNSLIDFLDKYPKSSKRNFSHYASPSPFFNPLNSAFALDQPTTFCFLLFRVTRLPPIKVKYPEVTICHPHYGPININIDFYSSIICAFKN